MRESEIVCLAAEAIVAAEFESIANEWDGTTEVTRAWHEISVDPDRIAFERWVESMQIPRPRRFFRFGY